MGPPCDASSFDCLGCHGDQSELTAVFEAASASVKSAATRSSDVAAVTDADLCVHSRRAAWASIHEDALQFLGDVFRVLKEYSLFSAAFCGFVILFSLKFRKRLFVHLKRQILSFSSENFDWVSNRLFPAANLKTDFQPVEIDNERGEEEEEETEIVKPPRFGAEPETEKTAEEAEKPHIICPLGIASSSNMTVTDEDGHMIIRKGDILQSRFEIQGLLGEGTFGKVAEVRDYEAKNKRRALKVIRNIDKYREAAKLEIQILEAIAEKEETVEGRNLCLTHVDWFGYNGHICLAFELLGESVFDFLKDNEYQPYTIEHTRHIMFQLISAVAFLHRLKITHTDLKPENLLFKNRGDYETLYTRKGRAFKKMRNTEVRLIDFGSATFDHDHHSTVVSTRHYRAPEVVLELGWSLPCDIWSIGCILFELCQGATMFQTHENKEHLAMMEQILGPIPYGLIKKTPKTKYFWRGRLDWDDRGDPGQYVKRQCRPLKENLGPNPDKDNRQMYDIMELMLEYNPEQRMTAEDVLKHGFFEPITHNQRLIARSGGGTPKILL